MNSVTALVPMKEHSERVPLKNFRLFNGKPLFYWIINELTKVEKVKEIYVNTDSTKIADSIRIHFPSIVKIIARPQELCGDDIPMNLILEHDLNILESDHFLQTHTTNPLLTASTVELAIESYFSNCHIYDSLFSVTGIQNRCYTHDRAAINHNSNELLPTQNLKPVFVENSNIYLFSKKSFKKRKNRIGINPIFYEMNQYESIDIDEEADFIYAEALHKVRAFI